MYNRDKDIFRRVDWITVLLYVVLVLAGWFNIFAAVYNEEAGQIFDISQKYGKQMLWISASVLIAIMILVIDTKLYSAFAYPFYVLVVLSLIVVYFLAPEIKGARAWLEIGSFRFQASEFAKLATSLVIARYLSQYGVKITQFKHALRVGLLLMIPALIIILQNDTGSALVFAAFFLVFYREGMSGWVLLVGIYTILVFSFSIIYGSFNVCLVVASLSLIVFYFVTRIEKIRQIYVLYAFAAFSVPWALIHYLHIPVPEVLMFAAGSIILLVPAVMYIYRKRSKLVFYVYLISFATFAFSYSVDYMFDEVLGAHQQSRLRVFFGMESDPLGLEFNVNQSKIAIGSGDFLGKGFLNGTQTKNNFVPEQSTDFIFCTIGEEWGFVGSSIVLVLFIALFLRIMFLAERQRSHFSRIYGYCVVSILFFHFLVNIGMTIGLMPVIGIPLPFFSYGGSSLWGFTMLLFIFVKLDSDRDVLIQ